jgi:hypothetical protein
MTEWDEKIVAEDWRVYIWISPHPALLIDLERF